MKEHQSHSPASHRGSTRLTSSGPRLRALGWATVAIASMLIAAPQRLLAQPSAATQSAPRMVTLITGDRVAVSGDDLQSVRVQPAPGRERVHFVIQRVPVAPGKPARLFVIPEDAAPLLQSGKVDQRLFDVTLLIESRYDDAHRDSLPFIVTYPRTASARALPRVVAGAFAGRDLPSVNGMSVRSSKAQVSQVWQAVVSGSAPGALAATSAPIGKIWLDALHFPVLDHSVPQIGAPAAWALGYEGDGVTVAVLDTGVDDTHPDLIDTVIVSENFTETPNMDNVGHGTHVASTIAGSGAASGGLYRGVAPGVQLLSGKVCEDIGCSESSMIAGMQWAAAEEGAQVVNLSIGGVDSPGMDPLEEAVDTLSAQYGTLFVISAGNDAPFNPVSSPGSAAAALTVAAIDSDDAVADFSSRGPTVDGALKPDIAAPGVDIVAARAAGTELGELVGDDYVTLSGTSMAAPHAAGAAALLFQEHPTWRGADVKAALMGSAAFNPAFTVLEQGAGRVDIAAALGTSVLPSVSSSSLGTAQWPHEDDEPIVRTVTYRNLGPATELAIELDVVGPDGAPAPDGMFTANPSIISLPEGGTAAVRITANTSVEGPVGFYNGRVIASDGASSPLAILLTLVREIESYNLTVRHLDGTGQPVLNWFDTNFPYAGPYSILLGDPAAATDGDIVLRLPKGRFAYESLFYTNHEPPRATRIVAPNQLLDADKTLVLDAGATLPIHAPSPNGTAAPLFVEEEWSIEGESGRLGTSLLAGFNGEIAFYRGEVDPPAPSMIASTVGQWNDSSASPQEFYAGFWSSEGKMPPTELVIDTGQVATVNASYAAPLTPHDLTNWVVVFASAPQLSGQFSGAFVGDEELPLARTEHYYSTDPAVRWINELGMQDEFNLSVLGFVPNEYRAGQTYESRWNEPVFSPSLPEGAPFGDWATRAGDLLIIALPPMYSDKAGHVGIISAEGTAKLFRNGEFFSDYPFLGLFELPPEPATYRLEVDQHQPLFELTSHQQVAWTFQSEHVAEGTLELVKLFAVRFTPELDDSGRAPSGTQFRLPLYVERFDREAPSEVSTPSVEASYDDGVTWTSARVEPNGTGWNAFLDHPNEAEYVSLRTSTHDDSGNAVEQTLYRAYGLKKTLR